MPASIGTGSEYQIIDADGDTRLKIRITSTGGFSLIRCNAAGVEQATVFTYDGTTGAIGTSAVALSPAANAAVAILDTYSEINLTVTSAANTAITTTSSRAGQVIYLRAASVAGGGSYTLAVTGGTLTLNSTGELAIVQRNAANDAWIVIALTASSSVGANIATIV